MLVSAVVQQHAKPEHVRVKRFERGPSEYVGEAIDAAWIR